MRRAAAAAAVLALLAVAVGAAAGAIIVVDDFEDGDTTSSPSWTDPNSDFSAVQDRVESGSWSGMLDGDGTGGPTAGVGFDIMESESKVELDVQVDTTNNQLIKINTGGLEQSGGVRCVNFGVVNGDWSYHDGSSWNGLEAASADQWYNMTFITRPSSNDFDVYIDGTKYSSLSFYSACSNVNTLELDYGSATTTNDHMWVDNIETDEGLEGQAAATVNTTEDDPLTHTLPNDGRNPVLTVNEANNQGYDWYADPVIYRDGSDWYMWVEGMEGDSTAAIVRYSSTDGGESWSYDGVAMEDENVGSHLAYPDVFQHNRTLYMVPERGANDHIPLYKDTDGLGTVGGWSEQNQLVQASWGKTLDHHLFRWDGKWWLWVGTHDGSGSNGGVRLFYSDTLESDGWTAHPDNPVITSRQRAARGAGLVEPRPSRDVIFVGLQDTVQEYGDKVRGYAITNLTTTSFSDKELSESPLIEEGSENWRSTRAHHYYPVRKQDGSWLIAVDGYDGSNWRVAMTEDTADPHTVSGYVLDANGDTVPGATVWIGGRQQFNTTIQADAFGQYEYTVLGNGTHEIWADGGQAGTDSTTVQVDGSDLTTQNIQLGGTTSGGSGLALGSEHTTTSDFLNAQQLVNVSATGDQVVLDGGGTITSGGTARYRFEQDATDSFNSNDGTDNTGTGYVAGFAPDGSYAKDLPGSGHVETGVDAGGDFTYSAWVDIDDASNTNFQQVIGRWGGDMASADAIAVQSGNVDFRVYDGNNVHSVTSSVSNGVHHLTMTYNASADTLTGYIDGQQVAQDTNAPMRDVSDTATIGAASDNTLGFTGAADDVRIYDRELSSSEVGTIYNGEQPSLPATYMSDWHTVEDAVEVRVGLATVQNVSVDVTVEDRDGNTLGTGTYTSTGTKTIALSGQTHDDLKVTVDVTGTSGASDFALNRDAVYFEPVDPELSNPSPSDATTTPDDTVTLSADVADGDFPDDSVTVAWYVDGSQVNSTTVSSNKSVDYTTSALSEGDHTWYISAVDQYGNTDDTQVRTVTVEHYAPTYDSTTLSPSGELDSTQEYFTVDISDQDFQHSGDTVTAELVIDGSVEGTDTLTSNGEANVSVNIGFGGTVSYHWNITDSYGYSINTTSTDIKTPGSIEIRNATGDHELIDNASGEILFYTDNDDEADEIYTLNASDGVVELGSLPKDESFVVVAEADGYVTRRVWIESVFETGTVYLPDGNATVVQPVFKLNDYTGNFPGEDTVLEIQRNVQGEWRTVEGDRFSSVNQFTSTLLFNERHRLEVTNVVTGRTRDLGQFTPTDSGTVMLTISGESDAIEPQYEPAFGFEPDVGSLPASANVSINVSVDQRNVNLDGYNVTLSSGGQQIAYREATGDAGTHMVVDLNGTSGRTVNATIVWEAADGTTGTAERTYSLSGSWSQTGLIGAITGLGIGTVVGSILTLVTMGLVVGFTATRLPPLASGGAAVAVAGAGMMLGWLPMTVFAVAAAGYGVLALSEINT